MTVNNTKPNIVFILLDTLRSDRLSCYGYDKPTSPNIDKFAENSVLFENAIASSCWTLPSHASLFTGLFPSEHGATDEHLYLDSKIPTLAELLSDAGYYTAAYSDRNGWLSNSTNMMRGFDSLDYFKNPKSILEKFKLKANRLVLGKKPAHSQKVAAMIKNHFTENISRGKPVFLFANLMDIHMPYMPDEKFYEPFGLDKVSSDEIAFLYENFKHYRANPDSISDLRLDTLKKLYDASVATVDDRLRELLGFFSKKKYRDNTVFIITSDHGECLGEHGLLGHWFSLCDTLIKVPLIISAPSSLKPSRITNQVPQLNLFHTILDLAGYCGNVINSDDIKSNFLISPIEGDASFKEYAYCEHAYPKMNIEHVRKFNPSFGDEKLVCKKQAIRTNDYKYIEYGSGHRELFDLNNDPGETENIINDNPPKAAVLRKKLEQIQGDLKKNQISAQNEVNFDPQVEKRLQDLGYL